MTNYALTQDSGPRSVPEVVTIEAQERSRPLFDFVREVGAFFRDAWDDAGNLKDKWIRGFRDRWDRYGEEFDEWNDPLEREGHEFRGKAANWVSIRASGIDITEGEFFKLDDATHLNLSIFNALMLPDEDEE